MVIDMSATDTISTSPKRDYSLVGESSKRAVETGLASAEWYHTEIPRAAMKQLMQRKDEFSANCRVTSAQ